MTSERRGNLIQEFSRSSNGLLLMTYDLGSTGLNLQFATTVFLTDFWWNASKTQQAIGRIFRYGQLADQVNVVFFSSNTAIEKIIFEKQNAKIHIINELMTGKQKTKVPIIKMDQIIRMIELEDNKKLLQNINYF
jgi:SNF2 family DNA or RNA helicase